MGGTETPGGGDSGALGGEAKFGVGQVVCHRLFGYRGVVVDVDSVFSGSDEWYERMARSRPLKDRPWYHVLVHDAAHWTYVAERNLDSDDSGEPIRHPDLQRFFSAAVGGTYVARHSTN